MAASLALLSGGCGGGGSSGKVAQPGAQRSSGRAPTLSDAKLHPGATNPAVAQANIRSTICVPGFAKKIRPPRQYTDRLKREQPARERLPGGPRDYEEDHLIPLELGGNPRDTKNPWPEPREKTGRRLAAPGTGAETKDVTEDNTKRLVCSGKLGLKDAQARIARDRHALWEAEGRPHSRGSEGGA